MLSGRTARLWVCRAARWRTAERPGLSAGASAPSVGLRWLGRGGGPGVSRVAPAARAAPAGEWFAAGGFEGSALFSA